MSTQVHVWHLPRTARTGRVTQARVVLSEWTKLHSLRSSRWSLLVGFLLTIALPVLFAAVTSSHWGSITTAEEPARAPGYRGGVRRYAALVLLAPLGCTGCRGRRG
jgi:hypothetical protein